MEAPEKIYLNKHPFTGELHDKWLLNKWDDSDIEYTRTDAFIERAKKYIANHFLALGMDNEINDFVTYMKGE